MNYKAVSRKRERDKCVVRHTYVLKANLLSDSCRSEAHLSNVTSPRQEKTPAIDSAESPDVAFGITLQKKHACLTNIMPVSKMLTALGVWGMQWGWRASFKQLTEKRQEIC